MVRACVDAIEKDSALTQCGDKKGVDSHDLCLGGAAFANTSLIGNDDERSTDTLSGGRGIQGEVKWFKLARLGDVSADFAPIQNSVAVQEQRWSPCWSSFTADVANHDYPVTAQMSVT